MTSLRPRADHQEAVARRLASLTAELTTTRQEERPPDEPWLADHTRIRPLRAVPDAAPGPPVPPTHQPGDQPPPVPLVGRHAARRASGPALVPQALRGRIALGPGQIAVVALLVAVALAVTGWWLVRGQPERLDAPPPPVVTASSAAAAPLAEATPAAVGAAGPTSATSVTVDVTGKVRRPGIVVLDPGARVVDALEAAGGARPRVDLSSLNLARVLVDGEQVVVGGQPAAAGGAATVTGTPGGPAGAGGPLVNLNTATQTELESLPEVGPVTAQSILAWRSEHGGFSTVDELLEVDGIGDATLAQIAPHVTV